MAGHEGYASMKCSSQRNCNSPQGLYTIRTMCLNEVQFPKELQQKNHNAQDEPRRASMKCSSQRNCNCRERPRKRRGRACLNEVQFPKELQPVVRTLGAHDTKPQ